MTVKIPVADLIAALRGGLATKDELMQHFGCSSNDLYKPLSNLVTRKLGERYLDEGKAAYRLTAKGRKWKPGALPHGPESEIDDQPAAQRAREIPHGSKSADTATANVGAASADVSLTDEGKTRVDAPRIAEVAPRAAEQIDYQDNNDGTIAPDFARAPELQYLAPEDYEMPPADPALLAMANRMLGERLEGVAHVLRGCGLPALLEVTGCEDLQPAAAALSGAYQMACAEREDLKRQHEALRARHDQYDHAVGAIHMTCRDAGIPAGLVHERVAALADELRNARALADKLQHLLDSKTHECEALRDNSPTEHPAGEAYLDDIHAALAPFSGDVDAADLSELELARRAAATLTQAAEEAVDVLDAAKGYLVRINKHTPRITITPKSAVAHAKSAARRGKRAKVYALVPVGEAVPGAEWSDAA